MHDRKQSRCDFGVRRPQPSGLTSAINPLKLINHLSQRGTSKSPVAARLAIPRLFMCKSDPNYMGVLFIFVHRNRGGLASMSRTHERINTLFLSQTDQFSRTRNVQIRLNARLVIYRLSKRTEDTNSIYAAFIFVALNRRGFISTFQTP